MRNSHRLLLGISVAVLPAFSAAAQSTMTRTVPASDVRELPADQQIMQALNRLTFGPKPGDIQKVRAIGLDTWIDEQLHPEKIDNSAMDAFMTKYSVLDQDQNELLREYAQLQQAKRTEKKDPQSELAMAKTRADSAAVRQEIQKQFGGIVQLGAQLQSERIARAVGSDRQLEEVMTDFWLNHFNIFIRKGGPEVYYLADYERNVIRPNSLGKFRDLLEAVAKSPAMLFYLDNARSMADTTHTTLEGGQRRGRAANIARLRQLAAMGRLNDQQMQRFDQMLKQIPQGLNENYGRELLELHTLGVDGGYTQQDVINVARAFTGWTINPPPQGGGFIFRPQMHDADEKIVLGHKLAAGRGMEDAEDVLTIVSRSPSTAQFIARKLAIRFVSDSPSTALVNRAAATFLKTDGDIRETLRTIITSPEFFSQSAFRSKVKSPFEVVASAMRAMNAQPDSTPRTALSVAYLGQPIYGHQAPNGWPETGESWMNTGAILNRINFGMAVAAGRLPGVNLAAIPGLDTLRTASRAKQVDAVVAMVLSGIASPDTRKVLESGENPLLANATPDDIARAKAAGVSTDDPTATMTADDNPQMQDLRNMTPQERRAARQQNGGAIKANIGNQAMLQGRGLGPAPQLNGIAQILGLALGSPEFQRR
jgi:uncharacterized protein (DUF1800 family)